MITKNNNNVYLCEEFKTSAVVFSIVAIVITVVVVVVIVVIVVKVGVVVAVQVVVIIVLGRGRYTIPIYNQHPSS